MKTAILDLGTNTFNLLLRNIHTGETLLSDKIPVKLGEEGIGQNKIAPAAFERGMNALKEYQQKIHELQPGQVYAFATSAIREASNGQEFIDTAQQRYNFKINLITGQEEAELIYQGVKHALDLREEMHLVMDVGGGSTEFIFANGEKSFWKTSYHIGSSRLLERFKPSDPIRPQEIEAIQNFLAKELAGLKQAQQEFHAKTLIGSSGSFETLASMILHHLGKENTEPDDGFYFDPARYEVIAGQIIDSTLEERLKAPGMLAMRADMIVITALLINFVRNSLEIPDMKLSTFALKEGLFYSIIENKDQWQKSSL